MIIAIDKGVKGVKGTKGVKGLKGSKGLKAPKALKGLNGSKATKKISPLIVRLADFIRLTSSSLPDDAERALRRARLREPKSSPARAIAYKSRGEAFICDALR